ncbi:MAG: iron-sulfur cluster assembly scaffold protein [Novosphingobium sp.]
MSAAAKLYSPEVLALATSLAAFPLIEAFPLHGSARAPLCGSTLELGLRLDPQGRISALGLKVHACAIGQASAALFARSANGKCRGDLVGALSALEAWLTSSEVSPPAWPGLDAIAAAHAYPARHGAILLPWKAALVALP